MNRREFEALRDLPDKVISSDIVFSLSVNTRPNLTFEQVAVENSLGYDLFLNGSYKPAIPSITFNFVIRGVGPVCRVDVNGTIHPGTGRTHKHDLRDEMDPRSNLPTAVSRTDCAGKTAREVWESLCKGARIVHRGRFVDPEGG